MIASNDKYKREMMSNSVEIGSHCPLPWSPPNNYPQIIEVAGPNRTGLSALNVDTDSEAIAIWLVDAGSKSENTAQSYRREAERLLLWATTIKGKSLSQLFREDFLEFSKFLSKLPASWKMTERYNRDSPKWRPFLGQPSVSTQARTMTILKSMIRYLVEAGWLKYNPMPSTKQINTQSGNPVLRSFTPEEVECIIESLGSMPADTAKQITIKARDNWLFYLYWTTAARASEATLTMSDFTERPIDGVMSWVWNITGKGNKQAELPLSPRAILRLMEFRQSLKVSALPLRNDPIPIIPSLSELTEAGTLTRIPTPLDRRSIDKRFKKIFERAAKIAASKGMSTYQLEQGSTHWIRHTSIREFYDKTGDLKLTQQFARHSNINTTARYAMQDMKKLRDAIE